MIAAPYSNIQIGDILRSRILESPFKREPFDFRDFMQRTAFKEYDRLIIGTLSITDPIAKAKFVDDSVWPFSSWELGRRYLDYIWKEQKATSKRRIGFTRYTRRLLNIPQALYYPGPSRGDLAYVDINRAYFQLYSPASLDLNFDPFRYSFGKGRVEFLNDEWIGSEKLARNAIVGMCRSTHRTEWKNGIMASTPMFNQYLAPELWGYLTCTLHGVAAELRDIFDLRYFNTDGAIVPAKQAASVIQYLKQEWELDASIRAEGRGSVQGLGSYRVGAKQSQSQDQGTPASTILKYRPELAYHLKDWRLGLLEGRFG